MTRRSLFLYVVAVLLLSWTAQVFVIAHYRGVDDPAATGWGVAIMFSPALVTLGFALVSERARRAICWKLAWRASPYLIAAFLIPTAIGFATVASVVSSGWGRSGWFAFSPSGVFVSGGPWLAGRGQQGWGSFALNVMLTGAAFALLNGLAAMGEELGWRGFLQRQLVDRLGLTNGVTLLGLIWAAFHLPILLAGYNYPEHPVLGAFVLFPLELVGASFFLAWLTIRSGSFWAAAVAHGAVNSIEEGVTANLRMSAPHLWEDLTRLGFTLLAGLICWALLAAGESARRARPRLRRHRD